MKWHRRPTIFWINNHPLVIIGQVKYLGLSKENFSYTLGCSVCTETIVCVCNLCFKIIEKLDWHFNLLKILDWTLISLELQRKKNHLDSCRLPDSAMCIHCWLALFSHAYQIMKCKILIQIKIALDVLFPKHTLERS